MLFMLEIDSLKIYMLTSQKERVTNCKLSVLVEEYFGI